MADHVCQQVIDAFATAVTGLTTTTSHVFKDRLHNLAVSDLPALRIFDDREEVINEVITSLPYMQHRIVTLTVEAVVKENSTLDATLNKIRKEIEVAISSNSTLGGICKLHCSLKSAEKQRDDSCETQAGKLVMTWQAIVLTMNNAPDVAL
jgi:hypothetical protein